MGRAILDRRWESGPVHHTKQRSAALLAYRTIGQRFNRLEHIPNGARQLFGKRQCREEPLLSSHGCSVGRNSSDRHLQRGRANIDEQRNDLTTRHCHGKRITRLRWEATSRKAQTARSEPGATDGSRPPGSFFPPSPPLRFRAKSIRLRPIRRSRIPQNSLKVCHRQTAKRPTEVARWSLAHGPSGRLRCRSAGATLFNLRYKQ